MESTPGNLLGINSIHLPGNDGRIDVLVSEFNDNIDLGTPEELNNLAEQYGDIEIDDTLVDDDDLLGEDLADDVHAGEKKSEALSQISNAKRTTAESSKMGNDESEKSKSTSSQLNRDSPRVNEATESTKKDQDPLNIQATPTCLDKARDLRGNIITGGKKRGGRSPEIRGANASRKLQSLRARASPKKKSYNPRAESTCIGGKARSSIPHMEVFPSASFYPPNQVSDPRYGSWIDPDPLTVPYPRSTLELTR